MSLFESRKLVRINSDCRELVGYIICNTTNRERTGRWTPLQNRLRSSAKKDRCLMLNLWFAVEDAASAASFKKSEFGNEISVSWFPATGDSKRPFPNLLN